MVTASDSGLRILIPRYIVVGVLAALAVGKLGSPYQAYYAIPQWGYYASAFVELLLAIVLSFRASAAWLVLLFALIGVAFSVMHEGDCG